MFLILKLKLLHKFHRLIDHFIALRSKALSFQCEDKNTNKVKGNSKSQSRKINFDGSYNCLFGGEYQKEYKNYLTRSIIHEMNLWTICKSTLSAFDETRRIINEIESTPLN